MPRNLHQVNWNDVKYFLALARRKRLTGAAKELGSTHVTVSTRVAQLEQALGHRLFSQGTDGFRLTREGKAFLPHAEECERQLQLAAGEGIGLAAPARPCVRVGVTEGIGNIYFVRLLADWVSQRDIELELVTLPKLSRITRREADLCVSMEEPEG